MAAERPLSAFASPWLCCWWRCKAACNLAAAGNNSSGDDFPSKNTFLSFLNWHLWFKIIIIIIHTTGTRKRKRGDENQNAVISILIGPRGILSVTFAHSQTNWRGEGAFIFPLQAVRAAGRGPAVQYLYDTNIKVRLQNGASHVSAALHLFDSIFTQEHNYQYREPLVKASKPVVLTRD